MNDGDRDAPSTSASAMRVPRTPGVIVRVRAWFARLWQPTASAPLDVEAVLDWRGWSEQSADCVRRAFLEARERGHDAVEPTHLLLSLLHDASVLRCLAAVDADLLIKSLDEKLERKPWFGRPRSSDATNTAMQAAAARVQQAQRPRVLPGHIFMELFATSKDVRSLLESAGFHRLEFLYAFSHGVPRQPRTAEMVPAGEQLSLVMENDDYTTQETVVEVLEGFLGHAPAEARQLMFEVHNGGRARVATLARAEAIETAERISKFAANAGSPLRVSLQTANGPSTTEGLLS